MIIFWFYMDTEATGLPVVDYLTALSEILVFVEYD